MLPRSSALLTVAASATAFAGKECHVPSKYAASNGTADDSPAIAKAFADCADGGTVCFAEGVDYNVLTPISATNLTNVTIEM